MGLLGVHFVCLELFGLAEYCSISEQRPVISPTSCLLSIPPVCAMWFLVCMPAHIGLYRLQLAFPPLARANNTTDCPPNHLAWDMAGGRGIYTVKYLQCQLENDFCVHFYGLTLLYFKVSKKKKSVLKKGNKCKCTFNNNL